jgi:hypothetical protein
MTSSQVARSVPITITSDSGASHRATWSELNANSARKKKPASGTKSHTRRLMVRELMDTSGSLITWRAPYAHWRLDPEPFHVKVTQAKSSKQFLFAQVKKYIYLLWILLFLYRFSHHSFVLICIQKIIETKIYEVLNEVNRRDNKAYIRWFFIRLMRRKTRKFKSIGFQYFYVWQHTHICFGTVA